MKLLFNMNWNPKLLFPLTWINKRKWIDKKSMANEIKKKKQLQNHINFKLIPNEKGISKFE